MDVQAIYFIKVTTVEDSVFWNIRVVTTHDPRDFFYKLWELRKAGRISPIDPDIRIKAVRPNNPEAERVIEYARQFRAAPVVISNVAWKGLYIEYALVAEAPGLEKVAA
ncbi:MAG TPA: hypothetical protein VMN43_12165 [Aestuariivirgaceae bacterium]|nr:hypothetical protein [Aestuariivirgaceae bacterium]